MERAVRLRDEDELASAAIRRLREHPNEHLQTLQTEVALLNRKVEPILKRVEEAARNVQIAKAAGNDTMRKGPLGMLSKMGGRLISFYADDLAEMLLQDFLGETAMELQRLESQQLKDYSGEEAKICAETLMKNLVDY